MGQLAFSAQGSKFWIESGTGGGKSLTDITQTNPPILTSAAHGLAKGDVVTISGVSGMTEINGQTAVVTHVTTNTFALGAIDASGYSAYTSGGTATPVSWTQVKEWKSWSGFDGQASEIDTTDLDSTAKEKAQGLQDFGSLSLDCNFSPDDAGQVAMRAAKAAGAAKNFKLDYPAAVGKTATFSGYVLANPQSGGVDAVVGGNFNISISGEVTIS